MGSPEGGARQMKLYELLDDELPRIRKLLTDRNVLMSEVKSISVEINNTIVIHLGDEYIFPTTRPSS